MTTKPAELPSLSPSALEFVQSVVALRPQVAVFDCDGTLWDGDAGADFFFWEIERGLLPDSVVQWVLPRYKDYRAGKVEEETMCGEMVTIHAGIPEKVLQQAAEDFFVSAIEPRIFPEMRQLTHILAEAGCEIWAVSSTNLWVICAGVKRFGIPPNRVLAATVDVADGLATDRLVHVPTDEGKAAAIRKHLSRPVDVCCGNSIHDAAMMEIAKHAFAIGPTRELLEIAREKNWGLHRSS